MTQTRSGLWALFLSMVLAAAALLVPTVAAASPGYMTCQIFDGDRNRVFYSNQPISADSADTDEAYEVYLKAVMQSGLMGSVSKAQGNCNWEARKADAAQKGTAFVQHFVSTGANPFGDRFLSDPFVSRHGPSPQAAQAAADAQVSSLPPKPNQVCEVDIKTSVGEADATATYKHGVLQSEQLLFLSGLMEAPGHGPWQDTGVNVFAATSIQTGVGDPEYQGLGFGLLLKPEQRIPNKLEFEVTVAGTTYIRDGIGANDKGQYFAYHIGGGPLASDPVIAALNKGAAIHLRVSISGNHDTALINANFDLGDPDAREALGARAMDAVALKAKGAC